MTSHLPRVLALLPVLLFASCGQLQIGERIRYGSELHVGVAREHAAAHFYTKESMAALRQGEPQKPDYVLAPEVTYRIRRPLLNVYKVDKRPPVEINPTGRMVYTRWVVGDNAHGRLSSAEATEGLERVIPRPNRKNYAETYTDAEQLGDFESPLATEASLGSRIAAAPFDYAVDPAFTAVNLGVAYTLVGCAVVVASPIWFTYWLVDRDALAPWAAFSH